MNNFEDRLFLLKFLAYLSVLYLILLEILKCQSLKSKQKSSFFDSGVGGLSVYKAVKALNPDVEAYYLFDNECFPYGNKGDHF